MTTAIKFSSRKNRENESDLLSKTFSKRVRMSFTSEIAVGLRGIEPMKSRIVLVKTGESAV
jgi:hypothetical protein